MPTVLMPDGTEVKFPDAMSEAAIRRLVARKFPRPPVPQPSGDQPRSTGDVTQHAETSGAGWPVTDHQRGSVAGRRLDMSGRDPIAADEVFADRMARSDEIISNHQKSGGSRWGEFVRDNDWIPDVLLSNDFQKFDQARRDFLNAQRRREPGTEISPEELANANQRYFPSSGMPAELAEQTKRNRQTAIGDMNRAAGRSVAFRPDIRGHNNVPEFDPGVANYNPETGMVEVPTGEAFMLGAADTAAMGFADEGAAGLGYLIDKLPGHEGRDYGEILEEIRKNQEKAYNDHSLAYASGMGAGGVAGGAALAKSGLSLGARAAEKAGTALWRIAFGSAADGAIQGGVSGLGSGKDVEDRLKNAGIGVISGGLIGLGAPYATATVQKLASPIVNTIWSRVRPDSAVNASVGEGISKSGFSPDKLVKTLEAAQLDGQAGYTLADALGTTGRRMLSSVARTPGDFGEAVVETLNARQAGQARRITNALQDAFDAHETAAARTARLSALQTAESDLLLPQTGKTPLQAPADLSAIGAARGNDDTLSRMIGAVDEGTQAAIRGNSAETIPAFAGRAPGEQASFRAGYADPHITQTIAAPVGVDKSRPLISDVSKKEFPAFAVPGRAPQLDARLRREQAMFETYNAATGAARRAHDAAGTGQIDPGILEKVARRDFLGAGASAVARALAETSGLSPRALAKMGQNLMVTDPAVAAKLLAGGVRSMNDQARRRALASTIMNALSSRAAGLAADRLRAFVFD